MKLTPEPFLRSVENFERSESLIRRNWSTKTLTDYDVTARSMADKIAKKLIERALEKDRQRVVRKIQRRSKDVTSLELDVEGQIVAENFVDVAVNRVFDDLVDEMLSHVTADVVNCVTYRCDGDVDMLNKVDVEQTVDLLQREMSSLVDEFVVDDADVQPTFGGLYRSKDLIMTDDDYFVNTESAEFEEFVGGEAR